MPTTPARTWATSGSSDGTLLATATFIGETATGWQQVNLSSPVAITANTTYVASYHTDTGNYAVDIGYFAGNSVNNGPIVALADGVDGGQGVFAPGATAFPMSTFNSNNYWVDIVFSQTLGQAATTTTLASSANPSAFGQAVTFTATVTPASGGGTPTGTVTFKDGMTTLGTATLNGGVATFTTSTPLRSAPTRSPPSTAATPTSAASSSPLSQEVNPAATTTALTSSANPSVFGQSVTFTATVSVPGPGAGTPTGTVTFMDGATALGTARSPRGRPASPPPRWPPAPTHHRHLR